jgi:hypothetical protein
MKVIACWTELPRNSGHAHSARRCALRLRSAGGDHRKPFLLGATHCILALRRCKARFDRVSESERHGIGL